MRFGLVHRLMTDALAALGLLSLLTSGELNQLMVIGIGVSLIAVCAIPEAYQDTPVLRWLGVVGSLGLVALQLFRLAMGGDVLELAIEFAAALQVIRLATRRGAAHDQQIILLALLHLVAGTVLGGGLAYGSCFLGFLVLAPGALVLSHLRREVEGNYRQGARDRTGLPVDVPRILRSRRVVSRKFLAFTCSLAIPVFVFTAILFVAFPRVGLSLLLINHQRANRMIGFRDKVDLGGVGQLQSDPTVALRVQVGGAQGLPNRLLLYLRGTAFDEYDGRSWRRSDDQRRPAAQYRDFIWLGETGVMPNQRTYTIDLEPIVPPVVFLPGEATALRVMTSGDSLLGERATLLSGAEGEYRYQGGEGNGLRYEVFVDAERSLLNKRVSATDLRRYLQIPSDMSQTVSELALRWASDKKAPLDKAAAIEERLRHDYAYDLNSPSSATEHPLEHFLFESKRGHCEFYSTAMAMLLRTLGVATRNVTGFIGGVYNRFGDFYVVRQGDAHSWVEVYDEEQGWTRFDPTPPGGPAARARTTGLWALARDLAEAAAHRWSRHILGYDLPQQVDLLRKLSGSEQGTRQRSPKWGFQMSAGFWWGLAIAIALSAGVVALRYVQQLKLRRNHGSRQRLEALRIAKLYQKLERSLSKFGISRPVGTPPYGFAAALKRRGHPVADEVLDITESYLRVRFGQQPLTEPQFEELEQRVQRLGQQLGSKLRDRKTNRDQAA